MKDIMSNSGGFSSIKVSGLTSGGTGDNNYIWTTDKINKLTHDISTGVEDIRKLKNSPFKDNDINLKRDKLPFEYTSDEISELEKCKSSVLYFVINHCIIQTHDGRKLVKDIGGLRDFQEQILHTFKNNNLNILMASRQTGKTVTSALYMLWFLLFHPEKTALCVADNFTTTKELIEKFKISLEGLPFYMKPGIETINASNVRFDTKSRLVGRTTTKKSGIGLTVNLLYVDEFAHIGEANLDEFYRAIFPTVTEDPNGKIILTSTPNGKNKFWEIWKAAIDGESRYIPLRVDWWQVKGRGDDWKKAVIADMGSVEDFNQEYGLQFFSSDTLLLNSRDLKRLDMIKKDYIQCNLILDEDMTHVNDYLFFHKNYSNKNVSDFKEDRSNFVFSIDTADGIGADFSVLNIYKVVSLPIKELLKKKEIVKNELDTVSLIQVGYLRSNQLDIGEFALACEHIIYNVFNSDQTRIVLELNHKGDIILDHLKLNENYWSGQMIHTKHTQAAVKFKPGLRLGPSNKIKYCEKFKYLVTINRIIPNDEFTITELQSFGRSKGGVYRGQNGNDDLAMTSVNISSLFESSQFWDIAVETFERKDEVYVKELEEQILNIHRAGGKKSAWDFDSIRKMNGINDNQTTQNPSGIKKDVFNTETLDHLSKLHDKFFKS
jgi:hypothetical protein